MRVPRMATALLLAGAAACADAGGADGQRTPVASGKPLPAGALRVQRAEIIDRQGFEKPLVAATLLVPVGWRTSGGVKWDPMSQCGEGYRIEWEALAPDGLGAMRIIPNENWAAGNFPMGQAACPTFGGSTVRQYLEWYVQRQRPGARVLDFRARPDLVAALQSLNSTNAMSGSEMRSWVEGGELLIGYQVNGKPVRESIASACFFIHSRFGGLSPGQVTELIQGNTLSTFAMRAPDGALDFKMMEALRQSVHSGPEWSARMRKSAEERGRIAMESNAKIAEINRRGAAERSAIIARTSDEINRIQMGTWSAANESQDRQQRETIEAIRGVETYSDPVNGGTVQLSNQYQNAWQLGDGSYVLTNDVNFDPGRDLGVSGQRLKTAP